MKLAVLADIFMPIPRRPTLDEMSNQAVIDEIVLFTYAGGCNEVCMKKDAFGANC